MPATYSTSLRFELQETGTNLNLWGGKLNTAISRVDDSVAGWLTKALTADYTLTTANGSADEARMAMLKFTGTGAFTVTIPAVSKRYDIWNACTGILTVSNGSASVTIQPGEKVAVMTDGGANIARIQPTDFGSARITSVGTPTANTDAVTKLYADNLAFTANAGILPGQGGNSGKFLTTDGTTASWGYAVTIGAGLATVANDTLTVSSASATQVRTGTSTTVALTPGDTYNALAEVTLTYAATVANDMATYINAVVTMAGNATLGNPTNPKVGQTGRIRLVQDGTGSRTLAYGTSWKFANGLAPTLSTTAGAVDFLDYEVVTSTFIRASLSRAWA